LRNRTIAITRAAGQADAFADILSRLGAETVSLPVIEIRAIDSPGLRRALARLNSYAWIILTSVNGAEIFLEKLKSGRNPARLKPRICAIGPGTASRIEQMGFPVHLVPRVFQAEGILEEFTRLQAPAGAGLEILLPRALEAREVLPETLAAMGAKVDVVPIYRTVFPADRTDELRKLLLSSAPDMITFTSSSTVTNFLKLGGHGIDLRNYRYASIGPITSSTAAMEGINISVKARESTLESLAEAIAEYFAGTNPDQPDSPDLNQPVPV